MEIIQGSGCVKKYAQVLVANSRLILANDLNFGFEIHVEFVFHCVLSHFGQCDYIGGFRRAEIQNEIRMFLTYLCSAKGFALKSALLNQLSGRSSVRVFEKRSGRQSPWLFFFAQSQNFFHSFLIASGFQYPCGAQNGRDFFSETSRISANGTTYGTGN